MSSISPAANASRSEETALGFLPRTVLIPALIVGHILAILVFDDHPGLAGVHGYGTFLIGLWVTLLGTRIDRVIYVSAYIVGCEVMWRMAAAPLPWEFAKYAVMVFLVVGLLRFVPRRRGLLIPLLFIAVLVPSSLLAAQQSVQVGELRDALSFNLSGPILLAVAVMFFRHVRLSAGEAVNLLWALVIPVGGVAGRTFQSIVAADKITFTQEANFATSGGFGPNQVSAILGLGALAAVILIVIEKRPMLRLLSLGLFLWFTVHSFLTFSRGGVYNLALAAVLAGLVFLRARGRRIGILAFVFTLTLVMGWLILPKLESFTENNLKVRFTSLETTQRSGLAAAELGIWAEHPLTGVGPGGVALEVERGGGQAIAAHTEFTRLLAEHGIGGVIAILLIVVMVVTGWQRARDATARAWLVAFSIWALVEMAHSAMRISAVGFCFGLSLLSFQRHTEPHQGDVV